MSTLKSFFKDSIIYGVAAVLPRVINFLLVRVHTDALHAESYAENTDFYIWAAMVSIVLTLGFETTFFRYFKDKQHAENLVATSLISVAVWVGIFILLFSIFFNPIEQFFKFEGHDFRLKTFIIIMALDTLAMIPFAYLRALNRPIRYTIIKLINVGIIVILQLITLRWIPNWQQNGAILPEWMQDLYQKLPMVDYIFLTNLIGSLISLFLVLPYLKNVKWHFDKVLFQKMLRYSYPIIIAGLAYAINENLDKWLIGEYLDKKTEGLYAAIYKLAIFMNLYIMAFRLGAEPFFFKIAHDENSKETYASIMKYFVIIGSVALVGIILYIDIFKHLVNENYWMALDIVPIILLANLFLGIYHNLSIWYKLIDKTRYGMWFSIVGALITILLNFLLLRAYGYMIAAWAHMAAYGVMVLLSYFMGAKRFPVPYQTGKILLHLGFAVGISFTSFYWLKPNLWIATGIMVFYLTVLTFWEFKPLLVQLRKYIGKS